MTLPYNTPTGYTASTTGNITGVYDMAGGAWEYVMGYNQNANTIGGSSEITKLYPDFFTNSNWNKYYDKYNNPENSETAYKNGKLGDATKEMGPFYNIKDPDNTTRHRSAWYEDYAFVSVSSYAWINRGGAWYYGVETGVFGFSRDTGVVRAHVSF